MVELQAKPDSFIRQYEALQSLLSVSGHSFFADVRSRGFRLYSEFGIPTHRDEEFKYTPLRRLSEEDFRFGYGANLEREDVDALTLGSIDAIRLVFVNGQFAPEASSTDTLPDGIIVSTFEEVPAELLEADLGQIATYNGKLGSTNDERFVALNNAYLSEGAFVRIAKNKTLSRPIHVLNLTSSEDGNIFSAPRILVVLEENAEAKLIEDYATLAGTGFTCPLVEVKLDRAARFEHVRYQDESLDSIHISNTFVHQEANSVYTSNNINFGCDVARNDINVWIAGEHTETWLNGANVGVGTQVIDNHTRIDHAVPNCQSFEVYKTILKDKAEGVFNGKIFVYEDAQKTDAKQTNQAILLSPTATMNTKPQLEIFADDVKCTHGATIGQLREDALFYLRARGVEKSKAEALLVYAFAAEVIDKVTIAEVRETLEAQLFEKLA
jgi:Fe-S cluster assembly protein SufD